MKFTSPVYSAASGSIAGITYSRNRFGLYTRQRSVPVQPNTELQQSMREYMRTLVNAWTNTLTSAQRAAWALYASNVAMIDSLGQTEYLSGQNQFIRSNLSRLQNHYAEIDAGPTTFDLGQFTAITFTASEATQEISVTFNNGDAWANADGSGLFVGQGKPQNASRAFFKGPFRTLASIDGDSVTPPESPSAIAAAYAFVAGQNLWLRVRASLVDGRLTAPTIVGPVAADA